MNRTQPRGRGRRALLGAVTATLLAFAPTACSPGPSGPPNVLVVVLDAARADHFGTYGYERDTTPHIDAFARDAVRYETAIAESAYTFASTAALMTGLPPAETGLLSPQRLGPDLRLLAEVAEAAGRLAVGYSENPYITRYFGFEQGFTLLDEAVAVGRKSQRPVDSHAGIARLFTRLDYERDRPFFAYVHLLRPHNPYAPPEGFAGRFGSRADRRVDGSTATLLALDEGKREPQPGQMENIIALYDENLAYGDALFGEILAGLRERGRLANTVVVLTSDHGEAFLEHGRMLHTHTTYDEMIRIPLIVRIPGGEGGSVDAPVQLADLGTALARVLGNEPGSAEALGALGREGATVSFTLPGTGHAAARTRERKLIARTETLEPMGYYDLLRDAGERSPLELDAAATPLLQSLQRGLPPEARADVVSPTDDDEALRERLEALGYIDP